MKKLRNIIIAMVALYVAGIIASVATGTALAAAFTSSLTLIIVGVGLLAVILYMITNTRNWTDDQDGFTGKTQSGKEMDQHYEAHFVSEQ